MKAPDSSEVMLVGAYHTLLGGSCLSYRDGRATFTKTGSDSSTFPFNPKDLPGGYRFFSLEREGGMEQAAQFKHIRKLLEDPEFAAIVRKEYLPVRRKLIEALLRLRDADPALLFRIVSDFQYKHFRAMIPEAALDVWLEGQISNEYYLKLSEPDGFLLGIAHENLQETLQERWKQEIIWIV